MPRPPALLSVSLIVGLLAAAPAGASPMRLVVRVSSDGVRPLVERIRGQVSDLGVAVVPAETVEVEATLRRQVESADRLGRLRRADLVVWTQHRPEAEQLRVCITATASGRILVRDLRAGPLDTASLEAAALVVRTAVRSQLEKGQLGLERRRVLAAAPAPTVKAEPAPAEPAPAEPAPAPPPPPLPAQHPVRIFAAAGWQMVLDGLPESGHQGFFGGLGLGWRWLVLALVGGGSLPVSLVDELATLELSRHWVAARAGWQRGWRGPGLHLAAGVDGGLVIYRRDTAPTAASVEATPTHHSLSPLVHPWIELGWTPAWRIQVFVGLGADVVPNSPQLIYHDSAGQPAGPRHEAWTVQPRFALGLAFVIE